MNREEDLTELMIACKQRDLQKVKQLVKSGSNVNETTKYGITPLMVASKYSRTDDLEMLTVIKNKAILNNYTEGGPIMFIQEGHMQIEETVETVETEEIGEAEQEVYFQQADVAHLNQNQNQNQKRNKPTEDIVLYLLKKGADVHMTQTNGSTALLVAAGYSGCLSTDETVRILLDAGSDPNIIKKDGNSILLSVCIYTGSFSTETTVKMLLDAGADPNIQNKDGETALDLVCGYNCVYSTDNTVKILLEAGANPNTKTAFWGSSLHSACMSNQNIVKLLLDWGANPNTVNSSDETPLHNLCKNITNNSHHTLELLLKVGANPHVKAKSGYTPLHCLCTSFASSYASNRESIIINTINILLKTGVDINCQTNTGATPLILTLQFGSYKIMKLLLEAGADPNVKDFKDNAPLDYLISMYNTRFINCVKLIKLLLQFGTRLNKSYTINYKTEQEEQEIKAVINSWSWSIATLHTLSLRYIIVHSVDTKDVPKSVLKFTQYK